MRGKSKKFLETNDNEKDNSKPVECIKAVLRGKIIAIQSYLKKEEKHRIDNLTLPKTTGKIRTTTTKKIPKLVEGKKS